MLTNYKTIDNFCVGIDLTNPRTTDHESGVGGQGTGLFFYKVS